MIGMDETAIDQLRRVVEDTLLQLLRLDPDAPIPEPRRWAEPLHDTAAPHADRSDFVGAAAAAALEASAHLTADELVDARIALINARRHLTPTPARHVTAC
ncbi:hypothetical protein GTS_38210 [Gandjariella thermophila]|uniref:Uncharacterized protein n=2 Tax=Gandjariella thermophila TaxID=1931992 RepID=A0A4D4JBZ8_9PSEU|nr:hypothetical protein GTS_38210 [Gandjariella thermophila]